METPKKPRILCLHGYNSNASDLKRQLHNWPDYVLEKMDLVFIDGPFPVDDGILENKNNFKWFPMKPIITDTKVSMTYKKFDEGISYIEDCMTELGPFDGVLGFSQGAVIAGALPGMQEQGACLTKVGKIKHVIIISGAKFGGETFPSPKLAENAFSSPLNIPSLHIYGETDMARPTAPDAVEAYVDPLVIFHHGGHDVPELGETDMARPTAPDAVEAYVDPLVIFHHGGHDVPELDEEELKIMFEFLKRI